VKHFFAYIFVKDGRFTLNQGQNDTTHIIEYIASSEMHDFCSISLSVFVSHSFCSLSTGTP